MRDAAVYCLGDSLTAGYGVEGTECWVYLSAVSTGLKLFNAGMNGDSTSGMYRRFCRDMEHRTPDLLFLLGGGNDIMEDGDDHGARRGMGLILNHAADRSIPVMLAAPYPFLPDMAERFWRAGLDFDVVNSIQREYAEWLRAEAGERGIPIVDLWALFSSLDAVVVRRLFLDGVHLLPEGHRMIADLVAERLKEFFDK